MVTAADVLWMAETIYMYIPAYLANAAPVLCGGGGPLDGGRKWRGLPLLGSHKTVRGTLSGIVVGTAVGLMQLEPVKGFLMGVGAVSGDLIVSSVKRRLGLRPGSPFPVADQLGFIVAALALASLVPPRPTWEQVVTIIVATVPIHLITNIFAWLLKLKRNPW
ncbi:MAG: CDP-2,3-bis-(O-geranylgeranyl)-sn-glycerol synthase [Candidatus Bathyarchaeota archaeon]|nr:CDP-2,3-bis-(O-geranylgeranyl)-sn-glycerol synthase [Candidatus Bathyarchaeota archaeon]